MDACAWLLVTCGKRRRRTVEAVWAVESGRPGRQLVLTGFLLKFRRSCAEFLRSSVIGKHGREKGGRLPGCRGRRRRRGARRRTRRRRRRRRRRACGRRRRARAVSTTVSPCSARRAARACPMPRFAPVTTATVSLDHQALRAQAQPSQARHVLRRDLRTGMRARGTREKERERERVADVTRPEATPWCSSSPSSWRRAGSAGGG